VPTLSEVPNLGNSRCETGNVHDRFLKPNVATHKVVEGVNRYDKCWVFLRTRRVWLMSGVGGLGK